MDPIENELYQWIDKRFEDYKSCRKNFQSGGGFSK